MDIDILKEVAFAKHVGEEVYAQNGKYHYRNIDKAVDGKNISDDYLVLTDEEADKCVYDNIKENVWTFNSNFIIDHTKLPYMAEDMIKIYQREKGEEANETLLAIIDDFDDFVDAAIEADGRGHFLATYDGYENEETVIDLDRNIEETFYIYRLN